MKCKFFVRHYIFLPILFGLFVSATLPTSGSAQNFTKGATQALSDWHTVQTLPAQTRIRITTDKMKTNCFIDSVTDNQLTCSSSSLKGASQREYSREEVKEIALLHRSRSNSTAAGAFLGLGVGAGVGALIGLAIHVPSSSAKAAGVGAAFGATAGVIAGTALGSAKDWSGSTTVVYRHP